MSINMFKEYMSPKVLQQYGPALPVSSQEEQDLRAEARAENQAE